MIKIAFAVCIILLIFASIHLFIEKPSISPQIPTPSPSVSLTQSNSPTRSLDEVTRTREQVCNAGGGIWREFPTTCRDECGISVKNMNCGDAMTWGCDCGANACWNGTECVD